MVIRRRRNRASNPIDLPIVLRWIVMTSLVLASSTSAQTRRYAGQLIQEVQYVGLRTLPEETFDFYLFGGRQLFGDGGGEPVRLDLEALDRGMKTLWQRELIDDIDVEAEQVSGGVRLVVRVVERPLLVSIDYAGLNRLGRTEINEEIDRRGIAAYENQPLSRAELQRLKSAIEDLYKEKGFRFADVSYVLEEAGEGQMRASFSIDEGDKVRIGDIRFDGNTVFGDWRLRRAMKKTKESGLISRFTKKDLYNPAHLDEDLEGIRDLYRRAGYKDALVGDPEIGVEARRPAAATISEQDRRLVIDVPVEEGERWRLGEILIEGNEVFGEAVLQRQFEPPQGGWLRSKVIDDGIEKIDKLYKSTGYIFADLHPEIEERDPESRVADVVVRIEEREQFRVGRLEFQGNTKTQDEVLRREMFVQEGAVMNMNGVQSSLLRIRQLDYFALDDEEPVEFSFDTEENQVNLDVQGEEAERTELQFGGGWSEVDGFFGQFGIRTTNFRGRGETLGLSLQAGDQRNLADLEYRVPWFRGKPQNVGFRLFAQDQLTEVDSDTEFESSRSGGTISYGRSLRGFQSFSLAYNFSDQEDIRRLEVEPGSLGDEDGDGLIVSEFDFSISSLQPTWQYNTLDSRFEPTRGLFARASLELAGSFLGGESEFVRPRATLTYFKPVTKRRPLKSSFGVNLEGGLIETFGGSRLFPQQRFRLGGETSLRGFKNGSVVVRDRDGEIVRDEDGFPMGGNQMLQLNLEYHLITDSPFRMVFFADGGGVFAEDQSLDLDLMRFTAGAELRIMVPLFPAPLRLIWAENLDPLPDDEFRSFNFSLSTSF